MYILMPIFTVLARLRFTGFMEENEKLRNAIWAGTAGFTVATWLLITCIAIKKKIINEKRKDIFLLLLTLQPLLFTNQFTTDGFHVILFLFTAFCYCLFMFFFVILSGALGTVGLMI